ncbi:MAG TPA: hypothetical protein P5543_00405 [Planctomycetota bacterium]|nr:hypothetical protein [Planctomycetota bacterium]
MLKKFFSIAIIFVLSLQVMAQTPAKKAAEQVKAPSIVKKLAQPKQGAQQRGAIATPEFNKRKNVRVAKSSAVSRALATKRSTTQSTRNISFIYPPYQDTATQVWYEGTGAVTTAIAEKEGYTYHGSGSYDWGQAISRCWVTIYFTPAVSGQYNISVEAYQEGRFELNVGRFGDEVYGYRTLGIYVDGQGYNENRLQECYLNKKGYTKPSFKEWGEVGKTYTLQAGRRYEISAYTEIGGWSNGNYTTWQTAMASCAIGPFKMQYLGR